MMPGAKRVMIDVSASTAKAASPYSEEKAMRSAKKQSA